VLCLCEALQGLPLESVPRLRGELREVTRVPNFEFIPHLLQHARDRGANLSQRRAPTRSPGLGFAGLRGHLIADWEGNLPNTRKRMASLLRKLQRLYGKAPNPNPSLSLSGSGSDSGADVGVSGWSGAVGPEPQTLSPSLSPSQSRDAELLPVLRACDLLVYCGHGAGEALADRRHFAELRRCASALLIGCSSGALKREGSFEPDALVLRYLIAGSVGVTTCLWDVTDKDIDGFTLRMLEEMQGAPFPSSSEPNPNPKPTPQPKSMPAAAAAAREGCKLKHLTGAAPVVYGVPATWTHASP